MKQIFFQSLIFMFVGVISAIFFALGAAYLLVGLIEKGLGLLKVPVNRVTWVRQKIADGGDAMLDGLEQVRLA
jgi:ABC-type antimicrobial peptide transport system permease subunit